VVPPFSGADAESGDAVVPPLLLLFPELDGGVVAEGASLAPEAPGEPFDDAEDEPLFGACDEPPFGAADDPEF